MSGPRKLVATFCAGLLVISAICALIFSHFNSRAFTAQTYAGVLAKEGYYDRLPGVLAEAITAGAVDEGQLPFVMRGMSTQAWEAFFRTLLPEDTLKAMGDQALDSVFNYLNMESDSARISLLPLKRRMTSDAGVSAVYIMLNSQPDCTLMQVAQMTIQLISAEDIQLCKPPAELYPLLTPAIGAQMELTASLLPEDITLAAAQGLSRRNDPRRKLQNVRTLMGVSPIIPLGFLLALTFLAVNSLKSWLDWWGIPFLATGLGAILTSLSGAPLIARLLKHLIIARAGSYLPGVLSDYASQLASAIVSTVLGPMLWEGIFLSLFGVAMVLFSRYLSRAARAKVQDPAEAKTII